MDQLFEPVLAQGIEPKWPLALFLFALGAVIGSFLNVVVYRVPRGMSLIWPRSRCPHCHTPIRTLDNVPIVGWLWLRGRCRACKAAISRRYPLVELATTATFVVLGWVGPLSGGANLPSALPDEFRPALEPVTRTMIIQIWELYAYQMVLVCGLFCAALTEHDGFGLGPRLVIPVALIGLAAPVALPALHPIAASGALSERLGHPVAVGLVNDIAGGLMGLTLGLLATPLTERCRSGASSAITALLVLIWTGIYLGWQAIAWCGLITTAAVAAAVVFVPAVPAARKLPFAGALLATVLVWIVCWRMLAGLDPRLGAGAGPAVVAVCGGGTLLAAVVASLFVRQRAGAAEEPHG